MAKNGRVRASKGAKAKTQKPVKAVDQEIKGTKKAEVAERSLSPTAEKKIISSYADRYNNLLDEKDSSNGKFMADARMIIEDASNETGIKKRIVREALQENRRLRKKQEKDAERDRAELEIRDRLEDHLGHFSDTDLGKAAIAREKANGRASGQGRVVPMPQREGDGETHEEATQAA